MNARELEVGVVLWPSWGLPRLQVPLQELSLEFSQRCRGDKNFGGIVLNIRVDRKRKAVMGLWHQD